MRLANSTAAVSHASVITFTASAKAAPTSFTRAANSILINANTNDVTLNWPTVSQTIRLSILHFHYLFKFQIFNLISLSLIELNFYF